MSDTIRQLKEAIEYAPKSGFPVSPDLNGWRTPDGHYVCAHCAGRIYARGCALPVGSKPVWTTSNPVTDTCVTCPMSNTVTYATCSYPPCNNQIASGADAIRFPDIDLVYCSNECHNDHMEES
jgi:hypothetical protein